MGSSPLAAANNSPAGYGSLIVNASCIDGPDWGGGMLDVQSVHK